MLLRCISQRESVGPTDTCISTHCFMQTTLLCCSWDILYHVGYSLNSCLNCSLCVCVCVRVFVCVCVCVYAGGAYLFAVH